MTVKSEWVAHIQAAVGSQVTVEEHDGEFDEAELRRVSKAAPAILVARLAFVADGPIPDTPGIVGRYSAFIVTSAAAARRAAASSAGDLAEALSETVWLELLTRRVPSAQGRPDRIRGSNLFTSTTAAKGFVIWSVTWDQAELIRSTLATDVSDLLELHTNFDVPPAVDPADPALVAPATPDDEVDLKSSVAFTPE